MVFALAAAILIRQSNEVSYDSFCLLVTALVCDVLVLCFGNAKDKDGKPVITVRVLPFILWDTAFASVGINVHLNNMKPVPEWMLNMALAQIILASINMGLAVITCVCCCMIAAKTKPVEGKDIGGSINENMRRLRRDRLLMMEEELGIA